MRTVLVCVRTPLAAQSIASCAARLGVSAIRAVVSETELLARLAEQTAELILVDTSVSRPDTVGFTRRVLARAPRAMLVLFGVEEPRVATAAVDAGARGLINADSEPVALVTKALLLIASPRRVGAGDAAPARVRGPGHPVGAGSPAVRSVPGDPTGAAGPTADPAVADRPVAGGAPAQVPLQRGDAGDPAPVHRAVLTEREVQVLRGMADGKSNAEIGRDLYVSEDTVKTHARRLFRKLSARDRAHAVAVGFRAGALR